MNRYIYCCVPGCGTKLDKKEFRHFFSIPGNSSEGVINPLGSRRRRAWIKAIRATTLPKAELNALKVCWKHFVTGRPADERNVTHRDWIPNINLLPEPLKQSNLVLNIPEVTTQFDVPDYVIVDESYFDEKRIEADLIQKYMSSPVCDENGFYINDHDYLGLPILPIKTEKKTDCCTEDHKYALADRPACCYFDSRHFCNICSTNCNNLFVYNNHMAKHTVNNEVTCPFCAKKFFTTTCLNSHIMLHTGLCEACGNEVPTVQLRAHKVVNRQQVTQTNYRKIYFCIFCMQKLNTRREYLAHCNICSWRKN